MGTQLPQKGGCKRGHSPQFSAHVRCGQTAGWMKTPLGTEVGLGPRQALCYMGTHLPHPKKGAGWTAAPNFRPMSIVAKRLEGSRSTWYGGRPRPRRHYVRWGLSSSHGKGHSRPHFLAHFALARSPISATGELLYDESNVYNVECSCSVTLVSTF